MSKWRVETISIAYKAVRRSSPMDVHAHSTRSMAASIHAHSTRNMAASKALNSGVSLQDVCNAAGWSSPHTFARIYDLDLSTPGARLLVS